MLLQVFRGNLALNVDGVDAVAKSSKSTTGNTEDKDAVTSKVKQQKAVASCQGSSEKLGSNADQNPETIQFSFVLDHLFVEFFSGGIAVVCMNSGIYI